MSLEGDLKRENKQKPQSVDRESGDLRGQGNQVPNHQLAITTNRGDLNGLRSVSLQDTQLTKHSKDSLLNTSEIQSSRVE